MGDIERVYERVKSYLPEIMKPIREELIELNYSAGPFTITRKIVTQLNANDYLELIEKEANITHRKVYELKLFLHFSNFGGKKIKPKRIAWASGVKIEVHSKEGEVFDHYVAEITILSDYADKKGYLNRFKAFFEMFELILSFIRQEVDRIDEGV